VLRSQGRRARIVTAGIALLLVAGAVKIARSDRSHRRAVVTEARIKKAVGGARGAIDGAHARATGAQSSFDRGVREAVGQDLGPRPDLGACPIALPAATSLVSGRPAFPLLTVERLEIRETLPSQAVAGVLVDVRRAEAHLAAGRMAEAALYGRALDRPERFGYEVVLVARVSKRPYALSGSAYEPGELAGRAYLYDFTSERVVCAGEVRAKSSEAIGYTFSERVDAPVALGPTASMGDAIREDIRLQTERAIVEAVRWRAGPPLDLD
jgi:hypothetical protein